VALSAVASNPELSTTRFRGIVFPRRRPRAAELRAADQRVDRQAEIHAFAEPARCGSVWRDLEAALAVPGDQPHPALPVGTQLQPVDEVPLEGLLDLERERRARADVEVGLSQSAAFPDLL
jgi:hypothetical protein